MLSIPTGCFTILTERQIWQKRLKAYSCWKVYLLWASESTYSKLISVAQDSYLYAMSAQEIWTRVFQGNKLNFNSTNQWKTVTSCNKFNIYIHICALVPNWVNLRKYGESFIVEQTFIILQLSFKFHYIQPDKNIDTRIKTKINTADIRNSYMEILDLLWWKNNYILMN